MYSCTRLLYKAKASAVIQILPIEAFVVYLSEIAFCHTVCAVIQLRILLLEC